MAIVADGHGNQIHHRSRQGSILAVKSTIEACNLFFKNESKLKNINDEDVYSLFDDIWVRWKKKVIEDIRLKDNKNTNLDNESDFIPYGTTLLFGIITENYAIAVRVGDGSIIFLNSDGAIKDYSLLEDNFKESETCSLCNFNSRNDLQFSLIRTIDLNPEAVFICSDGVDSCYDSESIIEFACGVVSGINNAESRLLSIVPSLNTLAHKTSMDDCSISIVAKSDMNFRKLYKKLYNVELPENDNIRETIPKIRICTSGKVISKEEEDSYIFRDEDHYWSVDEHLYSGLIEYQVDLDSSIEPIITSTMKYFINKDGSMVLPDKETIKTQNHYKLFDGDVTEVSEKKTLYKGKYLNGSRNGFGIEYANDSLLYKGQFKNGMYEGRGKIYHTKTAWCEGTFKKGILDGDVKLHIESSIKLPSEYPQSEFTIKYVDGKPNGIYPDFANNDRTEQIYYIGNHKNGIRDGSGYKLNGSEWCKCTYENGKCIELINNSQKGVNYCGSVNKKGEPHGKGKEYYENRLLFEGEYENGKRKWGTEYAFSLIDDNIKSSKVYSGPYRDGNRHGRGFIYLKDGEKIVDYDNGLLLKTKCVADGTYRGYTYSGLLSQNGIHKSQAITIDQMKNYKNEMNKNKIGLVVQFEKGSQYYVIHHLDVENYLTNKKIVEKDD